MQRFSSCFILPLWQNEICVLALPFRQVSENPYCYSIAKLALPRRVFRDINRFPTCICSPAASFCRIFSFCQQNEIRVFAPSFRQDSKNPCCYTTVKLALPRQVFRDINRFPTCSGSPQICKLCKFFDLIFNLYDHATELVKFTLLCC